MSPDGELTTNEPMLTLVPVPLNDEAMKSLSWNVCSEGKIKAMSAGVTNDCSMVPSNFTVAAMMFLPSWR